MPLRFRKSDYLADEVARMEKLKDNAEIAERVSKFLSSQIHALKPHRSDGKPRNEYMLYVWKSTPFQIGVGVYAPVVTMLPEELEAQEIISDITPEEYDAVLFYRSEVAKLLTDEGFEYEFANEGVTPDSNSFGRRPYATLNIYYGDEGDNMPEMTNKTLKLMGAKVGHPDDYEMMNDEAYDIVFDIWEGIEDEIELILMQTRYHPNGGKIRTALEQLESAIR